MYNIISILSNLYLDSNTIMITYTLYNLGELLVIIKWLTYELIVVLKNQTTWSIFMVHINDNDMCWYLEYNYDHWNFEESSSSSTATWYPLLNTGLLKSFEVYQEIKENVTYFWMIDLHDIIWGSKPSSERVVT